MGTNLPTLSYKLSNSSGSIYSTYFSSSETGQYIIWVANNNNLYLSSNFGTTWSTYPAPGYLNLSVNQTSISSNGKYQCFIDEGATGYYLSTNYGVSFNKILTFPISNPFNTSMSSSGQYQLSTRDNVAYVSSDYGTNWTSITLPFSTYGPLQSVSDSGQHQTIINTLYSYFQIAISNNYGNSWTIVQTYPAPSTLYSLIISMSVDGQLQFITDKSGSCYKSNDYGNTWNKITFFDGKNISSISVSSDGSTQFFSSDNGLYISTDFGNNFIFKNMNQNIKHISLSSDGQFFSYIYDGKNFGIGEYGKIQTIISPGTNYLYCSVSNRLYTPISFADNFIFNSASYNGNVFVAGGTDGTNAILAYSSDGINWNSNILFSMKNILSISWTGKKWYLSGEGDGEIAFISTENFQNFIGYNSPDILSNVSYRNNSGISYLSFDNNTIKYQGWNNNQIVINKNIENNLTKSLNIEYKNSEIYKSILSNGTYTIYITKNSTTNEETTLSFKSFSLAYSDVLNRWVICGYDITGTNSVAWNDNDPFDVSSPSTWNYISPSPFNNYGAYSISWRNNMFVILGKGTDNYVSISYDGINWINLGRVLSGVGVYGEVSKNFLNESESTSYTLGFDNTFNRSTVISINYNTYISQNTGSTGATGSTGPTETTGPISAIS
jgi:hypothetical protein